MDLYQYIAILRARWSIIVGTTALATLMALALSVATPAEYTARAKLFLSVGAGQQASDLSRGFTYALGLAQSYTKMGTLPVVLDPVIKELDLDTTAAALAEKVIVQAPLDQLILEVEVRDHSAVQAAAIANAIAHQLIRTVSGLSQSQDISAQPLLLRPVVSWVGPPARRGAAATSAGTLVRPVFVATASPPTMRSSPRTTLNLTVGWGLGLLLGTAGAMGLDAMDARVIGPREVGEVTTVRVLGMIKMGRSGRSTRLRDRLLRRLQTDKRSAAELVRQLRTNFGHLQGREVLRTVAFTSAFDDTATAATVSDLAAALAQAGVSVLVIDADVHHPTLSAMPLGQNASGLTTVLAGAGRWQDAVQRRPDTPLHVLPVGPRSVDPDLLAAPSTVALFKDVTEHFDVVLIKAPPVLRSADGLLVSGLADGVVVVTDDRAMSRDVLGEEVESLEAVGAHVVGIVLSV